MISFLKFKVEITLLFIILLRTIFLDYHFSWTLLFLFLKWRFDLHFFIAAKFSCRFWQTYSRWVPKFVVMGMGDWKVIGILAVRTLSSNFMRLELNLLNLLGRVFVNVYISNIILPNPGLPHRLSPLITQTLPSIPFHLLLLML